MKVYKRRTSFHIQNAPKLTYGNEAYQDIFRGLNPRTPLQHGEARRGEARRGLILPPPGKITAGAYDNCAGLGEDVFVINIIFCGE